MTFEQIFGPGKPLIGTVALGPLPGSAQFAGNLPQLQEEALAAAHELTAAGCEAVFLVNAADRLAGGGRVGPATVAALTAIAGAVVAGSRVPVGIEVRPNDAVAALSVAYVAGAQMIRVPVHVGRRRTADGLCEGHAAESLRLRSELGAAVAILADVQLTEELALGDAGRTTLAEEAYYRGLANALVLAGDSPEALLAELGELRTALPQARLLAAGPCTPRTAPCLVGVADGLLLDPATPPATVRQLAAAIRAL